MMSPMSTAAMNAVDRSKAGAASGVMSMSRMVGSTFGVAVMGAIVATVGKSQIDSHLSNLPAAARTSIANAIGSGAAPSGHAPRGGGPRRQAGVRLGAVGPASRSESSWCLIGAIASWTLIRPGSAASPAPRRG